MTTPRTGTGPPADLPVRAARSATRRRRRRADPIRALAQVLCVVLAVVGTAPFAAALVIRSPWARAWATRETERLIRAQGFGVRYRMALRVWPLALELTDVRVDSTDGGGPAVECARLRVRPRLFALLAGKLAIDQVELDEPRVRLVVRDGEVKNLPIHRSAKPSEGPLRSPFGSVSLTEAALDVDVDGVRVRARSVDLDVTAEDDGSGGSAFETALHVGHAEVARTRDGPDGEPATDEDTLCSMEARVRVQPDSVFVRRFDATGAIDLDRDPGSRPSCGLGEADPRLFQLSLAGVHAFLPQAGGGWPAIDGHVVLRAPIALVERVAPVRQTGGWVRLEAEVRYERGSILPDVSGGTLDAREVRLGKYAITPDLHSDFTIRHNVIESPETRVRFAGGTVTLSDTLVDPLARGVRLERTRLDAAGVDFTELLRTLGVHPHAHVGWEIREVHAPVLSGTFAPLKLDGDFTAKTYGFGIYDRPAEQRDRQRIFGFSEAQIAARVNVRPDALKFADVRAVLPRSRIDGGFVSLGFSSDLRVDAPRVIADLDELSPFGPVTLHGRVEASARIGGVFVRPEIEGDIQSIAGFGVADVGFGEISAGHVKVDVEKPEVEITKVRARRRDSAYEVPTAILKFGGSHGFMVDAVGSSGAFGLRDLLSMFALDDDPRFEGIDATLATRADVHVALGGPEDACGGGFMAIDAKSHLARVNLYGERFADGDADVSLRWFDRQQGIAGADVDVRSFVLDKIQPRAGGHAGAMGTLLGSASIHRGGALAANLMVEGVPLSRVDALGDLGRDVDGSISGVAHVTGDLDDFHTDAGFVAHGAFDVAGTRVRGVPLPPSHVELGVTHRFDPQKRAVGRTGCGAPIAPPFDRAAYLADEAVHEQWTIDGDLLGGTAKLRDVVATRAKSPHVRGRVSLRGVDLAPLDRILGRRRSEGEEGPAVAPRGSIGAIGGQLWGELVADDIPLKDLARARGHFLLGPTMVSRAGQKIMLQPPHDPLELADDTLTVPSLELTLDTPEGFRGGFVLSGAVTHLSGDPALSLDARLLPVDLAIAEKIFPKVEHANGSVVGNLHVSGRANAPAVTGELHASSDAIEIHGLPSAITDVHVDARASPTELDLSGVGKFAGGSVGIVGALPLRGFVPGALDSSIVARGIRLTPADGISATFDADLRADYDPKGRATENGGLPRVTGEVVVSSFDYTRPISLTTELTALGGRARRTEVETYDPALDFVAFDVRLRSREPISIKNNLVEAQLGIDSGALEVTGTNQRLGLRGALRTLPGGRFHFQQSDFEVRQGLIRFEDPTRITANVDVTAVTEYRRYSDTSVSAAAGVGVGGGSGSTASSIGSTRGSSLWRITLHAYGDADDLRVDMTSEPTLSQEDIVLLLAVGMTRSELDQMSASASSLGASLALNYLGATSGADRAVKQALPIIDDFRFGSAYSTITGKTEPQLTVGKRLTNDLRASVTAGVSQDRELRSNIEWRLSNQLSVQGSYDNINDVSSTVLGNLGVDLRWRLEFE